MGVVLKGIFFKEETSSGFFQNVTKTLEVRQVGSIVMGSNYLLRQRNIYNERNIRYNI